MSDLSDERFPEDFDDEYISCGYCGGFFINDGEGLYCSAECDALDRAERAESALAAAHEALRLAKELADELVTCHECFGEILPPEQPIHCQDCSRECHTHEESTCKTEAGIIGELRAVLAAHPTRNEKGQ